MIGSLLCVHSPICQPRYEAACIGTRLIVHRSRVQRLAKNGDCPKQLTYSRGSSGANRTNSRSISLGLPQLSTSRYIFLLFSFFFSSLLFAVDGDLFFGRPPVWQRFFSFYIHHNFFLLLFSRGGCWAGHANDVCSPGEDIKGRQETDGPSLGTHRPTVSPSRQVLVRSPVEPASQQKK